MIAPNSAPPAAAPTLAPTLVPSLEFSLKVIPAAVPPPMKAPMTPPPIAQSPQYRGAPKFMFAQPLSATASNASTHFETASSHQYLRRIVPPIRTKVPD